MTEIKSEIGAAQEQVQALRIACANMPDAQTDANVIAKYRSALDSVFSVAATRPDVDLSDSAAERYRSLAKAADFSFADSSTLLIDLVSMHELGECGSSAAIAQMIRQEGSPLLALALAKLTGATQEYVQCAPH